jgi:PTS system cellobiose-specific IIA component
MEEKEQICFQIISQAGMARSCFFESIQKGREAQNLAALQAIEKGKEHYHEAHLAHRKLVQQEAQGDKVWMSLLLSHAQKSFKGCMKKFRQLSKRFSLLASSRKSQ